MTPLNFEVGYYNLKVQQLRYRIKLLVFLAHGYYFRYHNHVQIIFKDNSGLYYTSTASQYRGKIYPPAKECFLYDIKQSDCETPALEI